MLYNPDLKSRDLKINDKVYFVESPAGLEKNDRPPRDSLIPCIVEKVEGEVIFARAWDRKIITSSAHILEPETHDFDDFENLI